MSVGIFPFVVVFFVLILTGFMTGAIRGQAQHGPAVLRPAAPAALAAAIMLLLAIGGALLIGGVYVARLPVPHPDFLSAPMPPQEPWPPKSVTAPSVAIQDELKSLTAEAPQSDLNVDDLDKAAAAERSTKSTALASNERSTGQPRPAWMDAPQGLVDDVYRKTVTVGPWQTRSECEQQLLQALREAVQTYADRLLGEGKGQHVNLPISYIHDHLVRGEWEERRQHTIDTMIYLHELLEFDRDANKTIEANYRQSVVTERLGYTAAGSGVLLGLLTIIFGYLKLDTLTRGYYTWRLRLSAATAIIAGVALIVGLLFVA